MGDDTAAVRRRRLPWIDASRGVAIAAMVVYHLSWDLRYFGFITADVTGALGWRIFARLIAASFLVLVGVGLVLADRGGLDRRFLRRLAVVSAAAAAVSLATWFVFPDSFVFFGILHCIAASSVLGLAFLRAPLLLVAAAAIACLAAPALLSATVFDAPALLWLGLATYFPRSNDYVPILPWFGAVLLGILATRLGTSLRLGERLPAVAAPLALVLAGRYSLAIYLVHQPLLFGLVYAAAQVVPPGSASLTAWHLETCVAQCAASGVGVASCRSTCGCLTERAEAAGLTEGIARNALTEEQTIRYFDMAEECRPPDRQ